MLSRQIMLRASAALAVTTAVMMGAVGPVAAAPSDQGAEQQAAAASKTDSTSAQTALTTAPSTGSGGQAAPAPRANSQRSVHATQAQGPDHGDGNASTVGDVDGPQPESNADGNDGGANSYDCTNGPAGPYCGTDRTQPSANGNGGGKATGRPGAGTVGKADNKNPPGQEPGPSDGNRGYECDTNKGIARGNPAHTACVSEAGRTIVEEGGKDVVLGVEKTAPPKVAPTADQPTEVAPTEAAPTEGLPATGAPSLTAALLSGLGMLLLGGYLVGRRLVPIRLPRP